MGSEDNDVNPENRGDHRSIKNRYRVTSIVSKFFSEDS